MKRSTNPEIDEMRLRLAAMAEQIGLITREIGASGETDGHETLLQVAERLYAERRRRGRHFRDTLFCEPAWDILLDLFIAGERGRDISVTSACLAAGVPSTTGLRWLQILEDEGLVISEPDASDGRRRFIRLTREAKMRMHAYLMDETRSARERQNAAKSPAYQA